MLQTKIVATIGPAYDDEKTISEMYKAGMRVARLNFSHGNHEYFKKLIKNIRKVSNEIAIMLDTKGPEIRSGKVQDNEIELSDNDDLIITSDDVLGTKEILTINYKSLDKLKKGNHILIDDGLIELEVVKPVENGLKVKVLNGGKLKSNKTVSLRGHNIEIEFLSKKDKEDIEFGIENNLDFVAASFVRTKKDVMEIREFLNKRNSKMRLISKIEHWEALDNIDEIILNSQAIMVARGDLGVEMPMEKVPKAQTEMIRKCNELGKPVIVATQMLESMTNNPRPTRAEISDVANAILEGTDAIMLSGETANGKYPIKAVKMMQTIAKEYESSVETQILDNLHSIEEKRKNTISMFVTKAAASASKEIGAKVIITPTESGYTARKVSRFKPKVPILAVTRDMTILRQLQLSWGVFPFQFSKKHKTVDKQVYDIINFFYKNKLISKEDKVVITLGHTIAQSGHTNTLEIYKVETVLK